MAAIDTNILVRLIARDHKEQLEVALSIADQGAWISHIVLVEAIWVLKSHYGLGRAEIGSTIEVLLGHGTLIIQDAETVAAALLLFRTKKNVDFTDCLILEIASKAGHKPLLTFDRAFVKLEGVEQL